MNAESSWQPVVPSHFLRATDNIVAGFVQDGEVALWRAADGTAQAWENRCPHRGTRFTLGRIIDGRLSCAYHGWEFSANGGRCSSIPAHPQTPAPRNLCATTFAVREAGGMVWVSKDSQNALQASPPAHQASGKASAAHFCRSIGILATSVVLEEELLKLRFRRVAPSTWSGELSARACTMYLNQTEAELSFAHVWLQEKPDAAKLPAAMAALARIRARAEEAQKVRGAP